MSAAPKAPIIAAMSGQLAWTPAIFSKLRRTAVIVESFHLNNNIFYPDILASDSLITLNKSFFLKKLRVWMLRTRRNVKCLTFANATFAEFTVKADSKITKHPG